MPTTWRWKILFIVKQTRNKTKKLKTWVCITIHPGPPKSILCRATFCSNYSCLGSLSCWKVNPRPSLESLEDWNRFPSRISLYLAPSIIPSILISFSVPADENDVLRVMRGVGLAPDIEFSLMVKKLNFSLIWQEYLLPYVWGVHMPFGECHISYVFLTFLISPSRIRDREYRLKLIPITQR